MKELIFRFLVRIVVKMCVIPMHVRRGAWAYEYSTNTIYCNSNIPDNGFMRHLREYHNYHVPHSFRTIMSILHEVGHYYDDVANEDDDDKFVRAIYAVTSLYVIEQDIKLQDKYFNLPLEWEATAWACWYCMNHYRWCRFMSFCFTLCGF